MTNKRLALPPTQKQIDAQRSDHEQEPERPQLSKYSERIEDGITEERAQDHRTAHISERTDGIEQDEFERGDPRCARESNGNDAQARDEFCKQQRRHADPRIEDVGLAHARIRRQRDAAEKAEHAAAISAAGRVPADIGDHSARHAGKHDCRHHLVSVARAKRSRDHKGRISWQGQARLIEKAVQEDDDETIFANECNCVMHRSISTPCTTTARLRSSSAIPPLEGNIKWRFFSAIMSSLTEKIEEYTVLQNVARVPGSAFSIEAAAFRKAANTGVPPRAR